MRSASSYAICVGAVLTAVIVAVHVGAADGTAARYGEAVRAGTVSDRRLTEVSGIAAGRANPDVLWVHNDSGGEARLFALAADGNVRAVLNLNGVQPRDWEDVTAFEYGGRPFLLVGDTGDNTASVAEHSLYLTPEPALGDASGGQVRATSIARIRYRLEGGPVDCEAVAVDAENKRAILIGKVLFGAAGVYAVDLVESGGDGVQEAKRIGEVWVNAITGADISPDGRRLIVSTYGPAYEWTRNESETWEQALTRRPAAVALPRRRQGEAICYGADGQSIYAASEGTGQPLWRLDHE